MKSQEYVLHAYINLKYYITHNIDMIWNLEWKNMNVMVDIYASPAYYVNIEYVNLYIEYKTYINYHYYLNKKCLINKDIGVVIFMSTYEKITY